ncbi:hypothetical protein [Dysgonomonas sp. GY617]|uniref:hypothetical protein n=1 Tax=Dysgonomonas sp. GY617 TaxID=2780420 RepID=UPI00188341C5|nr:hypothetical protein [Dysgonomonas sp. GY617]MBF0576605.1 hypothetical protein [Dysgonomonas sp. GY617]
MADNKTKNKSNGAPDPKDNTEVAGTQTAENTKTQTDNQGEQTPPIQTASGDTGSGTSGDGTQGSGDSAQTSGGESTSVDNETENKGTGEQGGDNGGTLNGTIDIEVKPEISPEKVREIVADELSRALSMAQANIDEPANEPKADTDKRNRIAATIFAKESRFTALHFTSDFVPFGNENDAIKHTRSLANKTIITIKKQ